MINRVLVLGIDPAKKYIPRCYFKNDGVDLVQWGSDLISTCSDHCLGVKFQSAYFENYGLFGLESLSKLIKLAKNNNLKVIMDAKRGDIGSTSTAYANAFLAPENDGGNNDFESDFLTVNPLMGEDCLDPFVDIALKYKKGIFILLETSNPGASMILKAQLQSENQVNDKIAQYIQTKYKELDIKNGLGPIGCVIGATNSNVKIWREYLPKAIFLMPGIGAQGGDWETVKQCLNSSGEGVWVPISRGISKPDNINISQIDYINMIKERLTLFRHQIETYLN